MRMQRRESWTPVSGLGNLPLQARGGRESADPFPEGGAGGRGTRFR